MKKNYIFIFIFTFIFLNVYSQKLSTSPLTRYGVGQIFFQGNMSELSMGKTAIADLSTINISRVNPATICGITMHSVIFDFSGFDRYSEYNTGKEKAANSVSSMRNISGAFRVTRWWNTGLGVVPYSGVGYDIGLNDSVQLDNYVNHYHIDYIGEGGINQFYWSNAVTFFKKLSIGANINYNFGSIDRRTNMIFNNDSDYITINIIKKRDLFKKIYYDFGFLYFDTINIKNKPLLTFGIGGIYSNKVEMKAITTNFNLVSYSYPARSFIDTLENDTVNTSVIDLPQTYGLGFSINYNSQITLSADYIIRRWSKASILGKNNFIDTRFFGVGMEYCRAPYSVKFLRRIRYRMGYYQNNSYITYRGNELKTEALTFGISLPFSQVAINTSFVLGQTGNFELGFQENFYEIHLGFTLYNFWFLRRKYM